MSPAQKAAETRARNKASKARMAQAHTEACAVAASGKCPLCGSGLRRNNALTGWIQCEQFGTIGFRKDDSKPQCNWQGFTHGS